MVMIWRKQMERFLVDMITGLNSGLNKMLMMYRCK